MNSHFRKQSHIKYKNHLLLTVRKCSTFAELDKTKLPKHSRIKSVSEKEKYTRGAEKVQAKQKKWAIHCLTVKTKALSKKMLMQKTT